MAYSRRLWLLVALAIVLGLVGADWLQAQARLNNITFEGSFNPPSIEANGKDTIVLTVYVKENGRPRVNTLLQAWLESGGGFFVPQWTYTDEEGRASFSYTPNAAGPYDLLEPTVIHIIDVNVGRILEVNKHFLIEAPVTTPLTN